MSLRVGWNFGSTAEDECQDVVMQDPPCWTATSAVLKAGRGLSSWLFSNLSPPSSPLVSSFFCKDPFSSRQTPVFDPRPQPTASHTSYSPSTPSFINKLPQELLEEIFREYLHGPIAASPSQCRLLTGSFRRVITATGTKTTPFTLAHVCSSWRDIVMSTPSLWSRLCAFRLEPHDIPLFENWLAQSANCPLDLTIIERGTEDSQTVDHTTYHVLLASLQHSERWKSLSLRLDHDMEAVLTRISSLTSFPSLKTFRLDLVDWDDAGCRHISRLLSRTPVLQGAAWGELCPISPFVLDIQWASLRTVELGHVNISELCSILTLSRALESLSISLLRGRCVTPLPSSLENTQPIQLPCLTSLTLSHYDDPSPLFDLLQLPVLSSIALKTGFGSAALSGVGAASLANLVHRSGCRILSLAWSDDSLAEDLLVETFRRLSTSGLPDLRHLVVESPLGGQAIDALTRHFQSLPPIFVHLVSLECRDCTADGTSLQEMIRSRNILQRVNLTLRGEQGVIGQVVIP